MDYAKQIISLEQKVKSEYYISSVFENLINDGNKVQAIDVQEVNVVGTPKELNFYKICNTYYES